ncbi:hypothetical protein SLA2020_051740 [Shorea laevis]
MHLPFALIDLDEISSYGTCHVITRLLAQKKLLVLAELSGEMRPMLESGFKSLHHHSKAKKYIEQITFVTTGSTMPLISMVSYWLSWLTLTVFIFTSLLFIC